MDFIDNESGDCCGICGHDSDGAELDHKIASELRSWVGIMRDEQADQQGNTTSSPAKERTISSVIMSKQEARSDIIKYLQAQEPEYFAKRSTTYFDVVGNEDVMQNLVEEYMRCVNRYGCDREWSCKDACDNDPGFYPDYD